MQINGVKCDAYKLRCSLGQWFFKLYLDDNYLGLSYGPFTYSEAIAWGKANPEFKDIDKEWRE
jgi:hypothetical protein